MDILHLVDRLEELLNESRPLWFTHNVIIDEDKLLDLIDQMRVAIPDEIKKAQQLLLRRLDPDDHARVHRTVPGAQPRRPGTGRRPRAGPRRARGGLRPHDPLPGVHRAAQPGRCRADLRRSQLARARHAGDPRGARRAPGLRALRRHPAGRTAGGADGGALQPDRGGPGAGGRRRCSRCWMPWWCSGPSTAGRCSWACSRRWWRRRSATTCTDPAACW